MSLQERRYTRAEVAYWHHHPENENWDFELFDGRVIPRIPHAYKQGLLTAAVAFHLYDFCESNSLGLCTIGAGHYPAEDPYSLVAPDVAFVSAQRLPDIYPDEWVPTLPDVAVELLEPWDNMADARQKAEFYLDKGTRHFLTIRTQPRGIEVHSHGASLSPPILQPGDALRLQDALPGFELELNELFAVLDRSAKYARRHRS